jgi:hypothetical protein
VFPVFLSFLRPHVPCLHDHSEPYLLIFLQKCIPRFPMHVNTVLINRFHTAVVLARWGANGIPTSQETHCVPATKPNRLMLFREIIAVYCENHTEHTNTLCGQHADVFLRLKQAVHIVFGKGTEENI